MKAEILSVGTELLLGEIVNTNAGYLSRKLAELGITVNFVSTVGDNRVRIIETLKNMMDRCDIIITTGGLGPTADDITKEACCEALGLELEMDLESLESIRRYFARKAVPMPEANEKQALIPKGATVFKNVCGTAPGCAVYNGEKHILMLPGPPSELEPMFENEAVTQRSTVTGGVILSHNVHLCGIGESAAAEIVADLLDGVNPTVAPYASTGEVRLRVTARGADETEAESLCRPVVDEVVRRLEPYVYGIDCASLEEELVKLLKERGLTLSSAESCTGGLIAKRITDIPGASEVFEYGAVTYSNRIKSKVIGVQPDILEKYGAVSEQTAEQMARGVREVSGSDIAISTTGIAGPGGGSDEKPVGLAYIALCDGSGCTVGRVMSSSSGSRRSYNRQVTANAAMKLAIDYLRRGM